jgi:hypothetical protein
MLYLNTLFNISLSLAVVGVLIVVVAVLVVCLLTRGPQAYPPVTFLQSLLVLAVRRHQDKMLTARMEMILALALQGVGFLQLLPQAAVRVVLETVLRVVLVVVLIIKQLEVLEHLGKVIMEVMVNLAQRSQAVAVAVKALLGELAVELAVLAALVKRIPLQVHQSLMLVAVAVAQKP